MKKKTVALLLALVMVFGAAIGGTFAYLTSTKSVTNTFTVGKVGITLDETDVDLYGVKDGETRVQANTYKLIPGHPYTKDPIVHVDANSEDCWIFAKIENGLGDKATLNMDTENWTQVDADNNVWAYKAIVSAGNSTTAVFDGFTFDKYVTDLDAYNGKTIVVTACAVQADGFETYDEAYAAATFGA